MNRRKPLWLVPLLAAASVMVSALVAPTTAQGAASKKAPFSALTAFDADGWGPFRLGETAGAAEKRLGRKLEPLNYDAFDGFCWNLQPFGVGTPSVMVTADKKGDPAKGTVVRIETYSDDKSRPIVVGGLRAGASKSAIKKAFPKARQSPHEYTDGIYLDTTLKKNRVVRFDLSNNKTAGAVFLGLDGAAQLVEGCA